eukprot:10655837-Heterocapsa_arctica.AAC.1
MSCANNVQAVGDELIARAKAGVCSLVLGRSSMYGLAFMAIALPEQTPARDDREHRNGATTKHWST